VFLFLRSAELALTTARSGDGNQPQFIHATEPAFRPVIPKMVDLFKRERYNSSVNFKSEMADWLRSSMEAVTEDAIEKNPALYELNDITQSSQCKLVSDHRNSCR